MVLLLLHSMLHTLRCWNYSIPISYSVIFFSGKAVAAAEEQEEPSWSGNAHVYLFRITFIICIWMCVCVCVRCSSVFPFAFSLSVRWLFILLYFSNTLKPFFLQCKYKFYRFQLYMRTVLRFSETDTCNLVRAFIKVQQTEG